MEKRLNRTLKIMTMVFVCGLFFVANIGKVKAITEDETACKYQKNITYIDRYGHKATGTLTVRVRFKTNTSTPEVDIVDLIDTMKSKGFGFNNVRLNSACGGRWCNWDKTIQTDSIYNKEALKSDLFIYKDWIADHPGQKDLCPAYAFVIGLVGDNWTGLWPFTGTDYQWLGGVTDSSAEVKLMYDSNNKYGGGLPFHNLTQDMWKTQGGVSSHNENPRRYFYETKENRIRVYYEILNKVKPAPELTKDIAQKLDNELSKKADDLAAEYKSIFSRACDNKKNKEIMDKYGEAGYKKGDDPLASSFAAIREAYRDVTSDIVLKKCVPILDQLSTDYYNARNDLDDARAKGIEAARGLLDNNGAGYDKLVKITQQALFDTVAIKGDYSKYLDYAQQLEDKVDDYNENNCNENRGDDTCRNLRDNINTLQKTIIDYAKQRGWSLDVLDWLFQDLGLNSSVYLECSDFCDVLTDINGNKTTGSPLLEIFDIIKIAAPILVIILGTVDFVKAVLAEDQDALKKAGKHFTRRLIAAVLIFFIPTLIEVVLNVAYESSILDNLPEVCVNADITKMCK